MRERVVYPRPCRYYPFKAGIPFDSEDSVKHKHALNNMCTALDMDEIFERVTIHNHGSFLTHGAIFKGTRDILRLGDSWACDLSPLELHNALTKRTAEASGARRLTTSAEGQCRKPMRGIREGPSNLIITKGYSSTMALSTLKHLLAAKYLRRGDGIISTPVSRRKERLFGVTGAGRTKLKSAGKKRCRPVGDSKSLLLEPGHVPATQRCDVGDEESSPDPRSDTCVRAFVRLLAQRASDERAAAPDAE